MRIYSNCKEAIREVERDLWELSVEVRGYSMQDKIVKGDEDYFTKELSPYAFQVTNPTGDMDELIKYLFPDDHERMLDWCHEEFNERVSNDHVNPGQAWKIREEVWKEFLHDGRFAYCVIPGSLILTSLGYRPIEELEEGDEVFNKDGKLVPIQTKITMEKKPIITLRLFSDLTIAGTLNHPLLCIKRKAHKRHMTNKEPNWLELEHIKPGDYIALFGEYPQQVNQDPDLLFLFGLIMSDGSFHKDRPRVSFTNTNERLIKLFSQLATAQGFSNHTTYNKANSSWQGYLHADSSRKFRSLFVQFSKELYKLTNECILHFLAGFCEGDGYIRKGGRKKIEFCTNPNHPEEQEIIILGLRKLGFIPYKKACPPGKWGKKGQIKVNLGGSQGGELIHLLPLRIKSRPSRFKKTRKHSGRYSFITSRGIMMVKVLEKTTEGTSSVLDIETDGSFICNEIISHNTYNQRIRPQLDRIIEELENKPSTRQAIIEIHNNLIDIHQLGGGARVPCSLTYQFLIRDNKLNLTYTMRSTDFLTHFPFDNWLAIRLQKFMGTCLGIKVGRYTFFTGSLHSFYKDMKNRGIF